MLVGQIVLLALKLSVLFSVFTQILLLRVKRYSCCHPTCVRCPAKPSGKLITIENDLGQLISYL